MKKSNIRIIIEHTVDDFIAWDKKYQYRGTNDEMRNDIVEFLTKRYEELYTDATIPNDFKDLVWNDMRYNYIFAKGLKKCTEALTDRYYPQAYESLFDIACSRLDNKMREYDDSYIDEEIQTMIDEGCLLTDLFLKDIEYLNNDITIMNNINVDDETADREVFLAIFDK